MNSDATKHLFRLDVSKINPQNYINNIRFMDFMATNNSLQVNWQDRPQPKDASYVSKGVPLELMIDLANRLNTKPWFCLPHQANNDTIKQFASSVKASL